MIRSLSVLLLITPVLRADWLQFRGPDASGVAPAGASPPVTLSERSIAWKVALPGRGLASPLIIGDRLFLTAASGPKQEALHLLCFSTVDGRQLWDREFAATGRTLCHEKTCNAAPTAASDGKLIVSLFSSNDLICTDTEGRLQWLRGLMVDYPNASNSLGMSSSVLISGATVIVQNENDSDSFTAGIDLATGVNLWRRPGVKNANWTSPSLIRSPGQPDTVAIVGAEGVAGLDPASGKERWVLTEGGTQTPSMAVAPGYLATPGGGIAVYTVNGTTPPVQLWKSPQLNAGTASPLILGDSIFALNNAGVLGRATLKTGERSWKLRMEGPFSASPVAAGATIYAVSERGLLQTVDATSAEGTVISRLALNDTILSTPAISGNALYLRSDKSLWKFANP